MDDYTWRQMVMQRRNRRQREIFFFALAFAAIVGFSIWYWAFYVRTPEYALFNAIEAANQNDAERFQKFVDLDELINRAYDDLTVDFFAYDESLRQQDRELFEKFYVLIKPQLVNGVKETILNKINGNDYTSPQGINILKGRQLGVDYDLFIERSLLNNTEFVEVQNLERGTNFAIAKLSVRERYTDTPFTVAVVLEKDDSWRVAYINNYRNYLDTIAPLIDRDIKSYLEATNSVIAHNNEIFRAEQQRFAELTQTNNGELTETQRTDLRKFLHDEVIPNLTAYQQNLDNIAVPNGAKYLAQLRRKSNDLTTEKWQHYIKALETNYHAEFDQAETFHKAQLDTDLRIEEIIKHAAINKIESGTP